MRLFRQDFQYWDDDHTKLIRKSKPPEFIDPDYYVNAHMRFFGDKTYFTNKRCRDLMTRYGLIGGRYVDGEALCHGEREGEVAYIACPGPSISGVDTEKLKNAGVTLAVNSAGFLFDPDFWVMAESAYARWLIGKDGPGEIPRGRHVIATARVAVWFRAWEISQKMGEVFNVVYVVRWEEEKVVPPRVPAVSVFNALVSAWQMGFTKVYLVGLDLSKSGGPYVKGVPYTKDGAANPFDDQIKALSQFYLPGFQVYNGSPVSKDFLPFEYLSYEDMGIAQ